MPPPPSFFGNRKVEKKQNMTIHIILKLDVCKQTQKIKRHYFWSVSSTIAQSIFHFFGPGKKCHSFLKKLEIDQAIGLLIFWVCLQKSDFNATSLFLKFLTALLVTLEMIHLLSKKNKKMLLEVIDILKICKDKIYRGEDRLRMYVIVWRVLEFLARRYQLGVIQ